MATKISLDLLSSRVPLGNPFAVTVNIDGAPKGRSITVSVYRLEGNEPHIERCLGSAQILIGSQGNAAHTFSGLHVPGTGMWTLIAKAEESTATGVQVIALALNALQVHL